MMCYTCIPSYSFMCTTISKFEESKIRKLPRLLKRLVVVVYKHVI